MATLLVKTSGPNRHSRFGLSAIWRKASLLTQHTKNTSQSHETSKRSVIIFRIISMANDKRSNSISVNSNQYEPQQNYNTEDAYSYQYEGTIKNIQIIIKNYLWFTAKWNSIAILVLDFAFCNWTPQSKSCFCFYSHLQWL